MPYNFIDSLSLSFSLKKSSIKIAFYLLISLSIDHSPPKNKKGAVLLKYLHLTLKIRIYDATDTRYTSPATFHPRYIYPAAQKIALRRDQRHERAIAYISNRTVRSKGEKTVGERQQEKRKEQASERVYHEAHERRP